MHDCRDEPTVALSRVTVDFGEPPVLVDVSLAAHAGDIIAIQGPNGSGKTSLLRFVANIAHPTVGSRTGPTSCAYVPSTIDPLPIRAGDWLRLFPRRKREDPRRLLQQLGFDSDLSKKLPDLSFGNLRKLLLAEALSSGEPLIVIDELAAGLDREGSAAATLTLRQLANRGTTIVVADQQDRSLPARSRVCLLRDRSLVELQSPATSDYINITLRGPRSQALNLTEVAGSVGFEVAP